MTKHHRTHHLGDEGPRVAHIQWLLHYGKGGPYLGAKHITGRFDVVTAAAVREAKYFLGYPQAEINAAAGDRLVSYLDKSVALPAKYQARRVKRVTRERLRRKHARMVAIEQRNLGYVEGSFNATKFGAWYGLDHQPWCAMFQSWAAERAGLRFHYAYCPWVVRDARARANGLRVCTAKPGALALFDWEGDGVADHIGLVVSVNADGSVETIEGNTSPADFSNGGMVMRRTRYRGQIQAFVWIGEELAS